MLTFINFEAAPVIGLKIDDKITNMELDEVISHVEHKLKQHDKVRIYVELERFNGMELKAFFKDLKFGISNWKKFEKEAVVTDKKWVQEFTRILNPIFPSVEVKAFPPAQAEEAKKWITS